VEAVALEAAVAASEDLAAEVSAAAALAEAGNIKSSKFEISSFKSNTNEQFLSSALADGHEVRKDKIYYDIKKPSELLLKVFCL
jgi:hypothetical protein